MKYLILSLLILMPILLSAQKAVLRKAEEKMEALDFQGAISVLEKRMRKSPSSKGLALLGECYRRTGQFDKAGSSFVRVTDWSEIRPQFVLSCARTLHRNAQYADAVEFYEKYLERVPDDALAIAQIKACQNIHELQNRGLGWWEVQSISLNSEYREFGPVFFENELVFCSDRPVKGESKDEDAWTGEHYLDLFKVGRKSLDRELCASYSYEKVGPFETSKSSRYHQASAHFSDDEKEIYFTGNARVEEKKKRKSEPLRLQIFRAEKLSGHRGWTEPEPISINNETYSVMHPCLSADEQRLFFASDMPGGFGGLDLYYARKNGGEWGPPVNMGPEVNTRGNEAFPYFDENGTFYFSSDGLGGLGGLDIFSLTPDKKAAHAQPSNPGFPINSPADDFGFIWDDMGQCGYFSSDRTGGSGKDDIYVFRSIAHPIHVEVVDADSKIYLGGGFLFSDCRADSLQVLDGQAHWEIPHNACCELEATTPGYLPMLTTRCTHNLPPGDSIRVVLPLSTDPKHSMEGIVFLHSSGLPQEGVLVQLIDKGIGQVVASFTTNITGRFEFPLKEGECYELRVLKEGYSTLLEDGPCVPFRVRPKPFKYQVHLRATSEKGASWMEGG